MGLIQGLVAISATPFPGVVSIVIPAQIGIQHNTAEKLLVVVYD